MVTDPIADMINQIKIAAKSGRSSLLIPHSNFKMEIGLVLKREGYLSSVSCRGKGVKKNIAIDLGFDESGKPKIQTVKRISKPSRRIYWEAKSIKLTKQGLGLSILSTPKGVLTDREAKRQKVGGEILFSLA